MREIAEIAARLLLPPRCVFCNRALSGGRICAACRADLPLNLDACPRCAEPLTAATALPCGRCQVHPPPWDVAAAPLVYAYPVDTALKALKFRACLYYAPAFAELLLPLLSDRFADVDALLPVPLHRWRQAKRGFNQALEICRPLARASGLAIENAARRVRSTVAQTGLDRSARRRNLADAFRLASPLAARYPLIVDDVMTTGETCRQLAALLKSRGAERVAVLTVARAGGDRNTVMPRVS